MDNVTHTLIGIAAAELLVTSRKKARVPLWTASALANNLPDLDVILTWGKHSDRLDYLLHHRGHTHTFLLAPLQGLILLGILWLFWRRRSNVPWKEITFLALLGPFLHVFADSWNTYGVHPFWPWYNRWVYGDLVFIVEPWLWAIFLPLLWKRCESIVGKAISLSLLAAIVGLSWYHPFVQFGPALAVTFFAAGWLALQKKIQSDRTRILSAVALVASMLGIFGLAQSQVRSRFAADSNTEVVVLMHPANPLCATVYAAGFAGDSYKATLWSASSLPGLVPAESCGSFSEAETTANLQKIPGIAATAAVAPLGEFVSTRAEFDRRAATCRGRAFLRFARIPFWFTHEGEDYFGDLRFDRDRAISFAEIPLGAERGCPRFDAPWVGRFLPGS